MSIKAALKAQLRHLQKQTAAAGAAEKKCFFAKNKRFCQCSISSRFCLIFRALMLRGNASGKMETYNNSV